MEKENEEASKPMTRKNFMISEDLWRNSLEAAKYDGRSLAWVIRTLLKKWLKGEVELP